MKSQTALDLVLAHLLEACLAGKTVFSTEQTLRAAIARHKALESVARAALLVSGDAETTGDLLVIEHMCALDRSLYRLALVSRRKP